jgi:hypothetical protein
VVDGEKWLGGLAEALGWRLPGRLPHLGILFTRLLGFKERMRIEEAKYSIVEIAQWIRTRELTVNQEYQRAAGLWPKTAKSYFIDTILKGFPFPKIYFHEKVDRELKKPKREIVDGQQRIRTIVEFLENKFALSNTSDFEGSTFDDLGEEAKDAFYAYPVSVDVIRNAERPEILEMFRRMNAYTLPLNDAEKRQSNFFGEFKSWVNRTLDEYGSIFVDWQILSSRQILRMLDTELIADLALAIDQGIVSTSPKKLANIYRDNDAEFSHRQVFDERIAGTLAFVRGNMSFMAGTYLTKTHIFFSLVCALIYNRWGLPNAEGQLGFAPTGEFWVAAGPAEAGLRKLAAAHEDKDLSRFEEYVTAASEGGNRANQRVIRTKWLCRALRGEIG